jgi:hypothetical protein
MSLWGKPKLAGSVPVRRVRTGSDYGPLYDEDGPGDPEFGEWLDEKLGLKPRPGRTSSRRPSPSAAHEWWWIKRGLLGFVAAVPAVARVAGDHRAAVESRCARSPRRN